VQDDVEIGSATTIDRGALGDTVIGEGSKLDNLVMIGHNCQIGRHCVIAGQTGLAGAWCWRTAWCWRVRSAWAITRGRRQSADGRARRNGSAFFLEGGQDYGGAPAKPVREWAREIHALARLAKPRKQGDND